MDDDGDVGNDISSIISAVAPIATAAIYTSVGSAPTLATPAAAVKPASSSSSLLVIVVLAVVAFFIFKSM